MVKIYCITYTSYWESVLYGETLYATTSKSKAQAFLQKEYDRVRAEDFNGYEDCQLVIIQEDDRFAIRDDFCEFEVNVKITEVQID